MVNIYKYKAVSKYSLHKHVTQIKIYKYQRNKECWQIFAIPVLPCSKIEMPCYAYCESGTGFCIRNSES